MAKTEITEGTLVFSFDEGCQAVKFDDTLFYRKFYGKQPAGKGVDILCVGEKTVQLIEIKDCLGFERENQWRTSTNNSRTAETPTDPKGHFGEDSFDVEVAKKVASTVSCLYGAWAKAEGTECAGELLPFWEALNDKKIRKDQKTLYIILFLEGNFENLSRSKKMVMKKIEDSIREKLSWMKCRISVVDSDTYREELFSVERKHPVNLE